MLTVYTDRFQMYDPLDADDTFDREYVVHSHGEYANDDVHINTCESGSLLPSWLSPHRGISKDKLTPYLIAFQLAENSTGNQEMKHLSKPSMISSEINNRYFPNGVSSEAKSVL